MASCIFFGSFQDHSASTLRTLAGQCEVKAVVTTPAAPVGRKQLLTPNRVESTARELSLPVFTPLDLDESLRIQLHHLQPDYFVVAGYRLLLPDSYLDTPRLASINIHYSLLPAFRGAMPAEWAILLQAPETGVSIIQMSPHFDTGGVIATRSFPLSLQSTRLDLYDALYPLGASLFVDTLPAMTAYFQDNTPSSIYHLPPTPQPHQSPTPYARKLAKAETYIPFEALDAAISGTEYQLSQHLVGKLQSLHLPDPRLARIIHDTIRATSPWPGAWTTIETPRGPMRVLLLESELEGDRLVIRKSQKAGKIPQSGLALG